MNPGSDEGFVKQDQEDLTAILNMRFGEIPAEIALRIEGLHDLNQLQRLIIVACNAPDWKVFTEELDEGVQAYKLTGERFNPLGVTSMEG